MNKKYQEGGGILDMPGRGEPEPNYWEEALSSTIPSRGVPNNAKFLMDFLLRSILPEEKPRGYEDISRHLMSLLPVGAGGLLNVFKGVRNLKNLRGLAKAGGRGITPRPGDKARYRRALNEVYGSDVIKNWQKTQKSIQKELAEKAKYDKII